MICQSCHENLPEHRFRAYPNGKRRKVCLDCESQRCAVSYDAKKNRKFNALASWPVPRAA